MSDFSFSFLLPTRGRPQLVHRFLQSVVDTTAYLENIEVILAVDDDDTESHHITRDDITIKTVIVPRGANMGELNRACFDASSGRFIMLINDDVVLRTQDWDVTVAATFAHFQDDIALVHVNDLLFRERLCTFPMLSRRACLEIGACPAEYQRYRIDDHIYDTYNILALLGYKRIIYLEDVVFEHQNFDEHLSGEEKASTDQLFESADKKVYLPNQEIIEKDAAFFESVQEQRKQDALALANLIDETASEHKHAAYQRLLDVVHDPFTYRQDDFVVKVRAKGSLDRALATVTVAVVTSSIYKPHAQKCLSALKKHTNNFELVILDNNGSPDFNHPREMNKMLQSVKTDYLVLMDDDVFVEAGWLEGMLRDMDADTGIITPQHKDRSGKLSYSGVYLKGDGSGTHAHTLDHPSTARPIQCMCSAIVMIDMRKCGHLLFNTNYRKYFLDLDYSLQVWEAGYKVVCTPLAVATHLGGGTMAYTSHQSQLLVQQDVATFLDIWEKSGRLQNIKENIWSQFIYLQHLSDLPAAVNQLFASPPEAFSDFQHELDTLITEIKPYSLFQDLMLSHLHAYASHCRSEGDIQHAEYCEAVIKKLTWKPFHVRARARLRKETRAAFKKLVLLIKANRYTRAAAVSVVNRLNLSPALRAPLSAALHDEAVDETSPRLLSSYRGHNIVAYHRKVYGIPIDLGHVDLNSEKDRSQPEIITGTTAVETKAFIDYAMSLIPVLIEEYRRYNLVVYERQIYGIPLDLGHVDLKLESDRERPGLVVGTNLAQVKKAIDEKIRLAPRLIGKYKNHNIVIYKARYFAIPLDLGFVQVEKPQTQSHPDVIVTRSLIDAKNQIDQKVDMNNTYWAAREALGQLRRGHVMRFARRGYHLMRLYRQFQASTSRENGSQVHAHKPTSELALANYSGFNIYQLESRYFAIPVEAGDFDVRRIRTNEYEGLIVGHALPELKREIDQLTHDAEHAREKALFICNISTENLPTYLERLPQYDLYLLTMGSIDDIGSDYDILEYRDDNEQVAENINLRHASSRLMEEITQQNYDLVIIPFEGRGYWDGILLEEFAASFTDRIMTMFPDGQKRLYKGEDVRRILYNKAYLNSMFQHIPAQTGNTILEVGCSDGLTCDLLLSENPEHIIGIDIMEAVGCNYPHEKITYAQMDAAELVYDDNSFDLVFSIATLEHCPDPFKVLMEMKRVIKPGGYGYAQAGPFYYSPFGHHMFGYFDDFPWIHLRMSKAEIIQYARNKGIADQIQSKLGKSIEDYVDGMLNPYHINGLLYEEYRLEEFMNQQDIEVLHFARSHEGRDLITDEILRDIPDFSADDLTAHGFDMAFRVK